MSFKLNIIENVAGDVDIPAEDGTINDDYRVEYLSEHVNFSHLLGLGRFS